MKQSKYKGKELLPLSVIDAARDGDAQAVDSVLRYYEGYINNVAVIPGFRRRHIASMLLEVMLDATEAEGIVSHTLEVRRSNKAARRLYEKYDFKETAVRSHYYSDNGEDAVIMWRMGDLPEQ